ncbi:MAG: hypothetical protein GWN81_06315 [Phycisphaerae bacterium]|nr:hypothetical protein [Phycisphaerae bacterium]NIU08465.1 hypothetical protein [Phycisphaerae bacterium]
MIDSENLNRWLTLAANVAVLVGIIALVVEIRTNTAAVRSQEWGAILEQHQELNLNQATIESSELYTKALYQPGELSVAEVRATVNYITSRIILLQRAYKVYQEGFASRSDWDYLVNSTPAYLGTELGQRLWPELKGEFEVRLPGMVSDIDRALSDEPIEPDDTWYLRIKSELEGEK